MYYELAQKFKQLHLNKNPKFIAMFIVFFISSIVIALSTTGTDSNLFNSKLDFAKIVIIIMLISMWLIPLLAIIIFNLPRNKYFKMKKLKNKIELSHNFTEFDVEQDFNNSKNIDFTYIGDKFIILLALKNADLHLIENIAWAFVYKPSSYKSIDKYYLFTMDFDGNKNITPVFISNTHKLLNLIIEKCPNACIGYSEELLNTSKENIENIKRFDKSTLDPYYLPEFTKYNPILDYLYN